MRRWRELLVLAGSAGLALAACSSLPDAGSPAGGDGAGSQATSAAGNAGLPGMPGLPGLPGLAGGSGAPGLPGFLPPVPSGALLPTTDPKTALVTYTLGGQTITSPVVVECQISPDSISIATSNERGTGGVAVDWSAAAANLATITVSDVGDGGYVLSRSFEGAPPPEVTVDGDTARITVMLKEQVFGEHDPESVTIDATCHAPSAGDQLPEPTPVSVGHASVQVNGQTYDFDFADTCLISDGFINAAFTADEGMLTVASAGDGQFVTLSVPGEDWLAGVGGGDMLHFDVSGSAASWSGSLQDPASGKTAKATISLECAGP